MNKLRKVLKVPLADYVLLVSTLVLVWAIRLGLWVLPFPTMRKLVARAIGEPARRKIASPEDATAAGKICPSIWHLKWAVQVTSRYVPQATCLTQALVMQILMGRRGHEAIVHIGVARGDTKKFEAHAWVESQGHVIIGGGRAERWTPLTTLEVNSS